MQIWSTGFQMAVSVSPEEPREEKKKKPRFLGLLPSIKSLHIQGRALESAFYKYPS